MEADFAAGRARVVVATVAFGKQHRACSDKDEYEVLGNRPAAASDRAKRGAQPDVESVSRKNAADYIHSAPASVLSLPRMRLVCRFRLSVVLHASALCSLCRHGHQPSWRGCRGACHHAAQPGGVRAAGGAEPAVTALPPLGRGACSSRCCYRAVLCMPPGQQTGVWGVHPVPPPALAPDHRLAAPGVTAARRAAWPC